MNDQQRVETCRKIDRHQDKANFELLDHVDVEHGKIAPNCYQLIYDGITVYVGVVFGNIAYYHDNDENFWINSIPKNGLPVELQDKADRAILAYHDSLTNQGER